MPSGSDPTLKTAARRRILAHWRERALPDCQHPACKYPGTPIDYTAPKGARLALDVDEITPRVHGGRADDLANTRPTHAGCNRADGARHTNRLRRAKGQAKRAAQEAVTSRTWW